MVIGQETTATPNAGEQTPPATQSGEQTGQPAQQPSEGNGAQPQGQPTGEQPGAAQEEPTVPLAALKAEREKRRKLRDQLLRQQKQGVPAQSNQQIDPNDPAQLAQELQRVGTEKAILEIKQEAREKLEDYPNIPKYLKKQILRNPLGFVDHNVASVDAAIFQLELYLEEQDEAFAAQKGQETQGDSPPGTQKKNPQVAGNNSPTATMPGTTPAEIQAILDKPVDDWTKEENEKLDEYKKSLS